jgi:hypothetical protein
MAELWDELEDFLDRVVGPLPVGESTDGETSAVPPRPPLVVDDDFKADRLSRKHAHVQAEIAQRSAEIAQWQRHYRDFRVERNARDARRLEALEGLLRAYTEHLRALGKLGREKGHTLPSGRLQFRTYPIAYEVIPGQEAQFLAWCEPRGLTIVTVEPDLSRASVQFHAVQNVYGSPVYVTQVDEETGEVCEERVPGIQVARPAGESFTVQHPKPKALPGVPPMLDEVV